MRSPTLTALLNPLNLAMLAMAAAAGLCAAWWLFPIGLILWGVMVYSIASDPALRTAQVSESRAPLAQRFQLQFDRLERTQNSITNAIAGANRRVRTVLQPIQNEVDKLVEETHRLCLRMTALENYRVVQSANANLEGELFRVESQIAATADPTVKREYEETKAAIQKRMSAFRAISTQSDLVEAQLGSLNAEIDGVLADVVRLQSLGPDKAGSAVPAIVENLRQQTREVEAFEQKVAQLGK
jgi:chromosome segregation ATPase